MNNRVTDKDLKKDGISTIEEIIRQNAKAVITVQGKSKYVVIPIEEFKKLKDYEQEAAIIESLNDLQNGALYDESIDEHIRRIS